MVKKNFPKDFLWGAATAAFQIEGHPDECSQKLSDWSLWIDKKDKVFEPTNDGKAVDHWSHMPEDVALMADMNLNSYRFSFNWAALHRGPGDFDQKTIDFYHKLLAELESKSIKPFATLIHFVLPQWLVEKGGWEHPDTAKEFANFAGKMAAEFAGKIDNWITHNEPNIFLHFGYISGIWPPGQENNWQSYLTAYQGILLGHQLAYDAIKEQDSKAQVGCAQNLYKFENASDFIAPTIIKEHIHNHAFIQDCFDMGRLDFLGINYYTRMVYEFKAGSKDFANPGLESPLWSEIKEPEAETNALNWEIYPQGLCDLLLDEKLKRIIGDMPIYITENGYCHIEGAKADEGYSSFVDNGNGDKDIDDQYRIEFIKSHLQAIQEAVSKGANVKGYFYWSLLDNFEWALGMRPRFGLIHVDHESFERKPKQSSEYYAKVIKANAID